MESFYFVSMGAVRKYKRTISLPVALVSYIMAGLSLISLVARFLDVGLIGVIGNFVEFYQLFSNAVFNFFPRLFGVTFPQNLVDAWTLSFIGVAAFFRSEGYNTTRYFVEIVKKDPEENFGLKLRYILILGFGLFGIGFLLSSFSPLTFVDDFHERPLDVAKKTSLNVIYLFLGMTFAFAINFGQQLL